jgi:hypothetical protein
MIKQILYQAILVLMRAVRSSLVAVVFSILASLIMFPKLKYIPVFPLTIFTVSLLLPAIFLYHIGCALKLKKIIYDILYFIGFISINLFFLSVIIRAFWFSPPTSDLEGIEFYIFYLYIFTITGIAVYFAEIVFRSKKYLIELGYKDLPIETDLNCIFEQISKQSKSIFRGIVRSGIIAAIVVFVASVAPRSLHYFKMISTYIPFGLILLLICLLPLVILYQVIHALKIKPLTRNIVYFVIVTFMIVFFTGLLGSIRPNFVKFHNFAGAVLAFASIIVYMAEVYFRNRAILKNLGQK